MRSRRFVSREQRDLYRETLVSPLPELGLVAADGPLDPAPELVIEEGIVVRMDGRAAAEFDVIDRFVVAHGLDLGVAAEAMAIDDVELARMLVDIDVSRAELVRLARGLTPAKLARVIGLLDPVELMLALKKLRARRAPANQAHVTNLKESPALLAADAAEAARRGFAEIETTVGVARYAPLNAIALLVGSQTGRPGVMTQCAVEERRNLELAIRGLVTYAETLSVYGTEPVFVDGDDTPWSKAFLGAAYASRGVKVRFTSGTGSEALMGYAQGLSMLYLEARCLAAVRAAGSQGVQNGSISCVALVLSVPGGTRAILGENVLAAWLDLEVASGNDAIASHSEIRKTAKLMGQFLPGTDFVTSGYSVMPRHDNTFGGGNFDADDLDEWLTVQRDWQVDAGIEPVSEDEVLRVRERAAHAVQAVFEELELPPVSCEEVAAATTGYDSSEMPDRDRAADVEAADGLLARGVSGLDVALALDHRGFGEIAEAVVSMQRQRVSADYLQTAAVIDAQGLVHSAVNDPNVYSGPGTGYRLEGERWELLQSLPNVVDPAQLLGSSDEGEPVVIEHGEAKRGEDATEVVVAVGPAFADAIRKTINDLSHGDVLESICEGVRVAGARPRVVRVRRTADVAFIAHDGARLSGSGIALGVQSKGTAVIHRADLEPLDNLELFGMSPLYTLESYRAMGRNAAGYALGQRVGPVPTELDNFARAKLIVKTTLLHARETKAVLPGAAAVEIVLDGAGRVSEPPQTWHYGLVAKWWSEFNDDFRPHEIPYFQKFIERDGQPALDVACGTGRLLLPYLRAGLDVDACDVSADMVALCREKAAGEGFSPNLYVQPMHALDLPRRYRTIYVCGAFGLGSTRGQDLEALECFHEYLESGGTLIFDYEVPYADARQWQYWLKDERALLPEAPRPPGGRRRASDGAEYALSSRVAALDPLDQRVTLEMHAEMWRDETLQAEESRTLDINLYFRNELLLMLERAGFADVSVHGEHTEAEPTSDDAFLVFVARK